MNCQKRKASFEYVLLRLPYNFDIFRPNISHLYFEKYFNTIYILKNVKGSHHDSSSNMRIFTNSLKDYYKKKIKSYYLLRKFSEKSIKQFSYPKKTFSFYVISKPLSNGFCIKYQKCEMTIVLPKYTFSFLFKNNWICTILI